MENTQNMLTENLETIRVKHGMENHEILQLKKLGFIEILKEAIKIPYKYPKVIFLVFLTSLPLMFSMVFYEIILLASIVETKSLLSAPPPPRPPPPPLDFTLHTNDYFYYASKRYYIDISEPDSIMTLFYIMTPRIFQLAFLYLVVIHLLDVFNTIITIHSASRLYAERPMKFWKILLISTSKTGFIGPLITSLYVLFLNSFILFEFVGVVTCLFSEPFGSILMICVGVGSIILTIKWAEWSAVWNLSIVFSVLEDRHGFTALGVAGYISQGNRIRGRHLMLLFYVWRMSLRLLCHYVCGGEWTWVESITASFLSCVVNMMKWIVCTVYFYDCKKRSLEKKIDDEQSAVDKNANMGMTQSTDLDLV